MFAMKFVRIVQCALAKRSRERFTVFTLLAALCFTIGLLLPFVQVAPGEDLDPIQGVLVWLLSDEEVYSLFASILAIWDSNWALGAAAFAFSVLSPSLKLFALSCCALAKCPTRVGIYQRLAKFLGPWSMVEVFLVALTLVFIKPLPFGTIIHPLLGFYFFWTSVTMSLLAACSFPKLKPAES